MIFELFISPILQISHVVRFSIIHTTKKETVADHTGQVGIIAVVIADRCKRLGANVDLGKVALYSLFHDCEEAITGDIPRPSKYFSEGTREGLEDLSDSVVQVMAKDLRFPDLVTYWRDSKEKGLEGLIVGMADLIQAIKKVTEEVNLYGNYSMLKVGIEISEFIGNVRGKIEKAGLSQEVEFLLLQVMTETEQILDETIKSHRGQLSYCSIRRDYLEKHGLEYFEEEAECTLLAGEESSPRQ